MKNLLTLILFLPLGISFSQTFTYPTLILEGSNPSDFLPKNWSILDSASGDLNNDKITDYVLIFQCKDSVSTLDRFNDTILTKPRILAILFQDKISKKLVLIEQNNSFIINTDNPSLEDPYQSVSIEKGILNLHFQLLYNAGSWYITNTAYSFRYHCKNFELIGADYNSFNRATHDFENYSFNFLTKKYSINKGSDESGEKPTTEWSSIKLQKLKTIKTLSAPYTWHVTKDVIL
jgi:hypothetical protein